MQQSITRGAVQTVRRSSKQSSSRCSSSSSSKASSSLSTLPSRRRSTRSTIPSAHSAIYKLGSHQLGPVKASFFSTSASCLSNLSTTSLPCPACFHEIPVDIDSIQTLAQCPKCSAFLPPPPQLSAEPDYFALFQLSPSFDVDKADLRRSFLQWQGRVHPDRLSQVEESGGTTRKKQEMYAAAWSSMVNEGYKMLLSDSARGEYMLRRRGVAIEEQDKMEDPELLMEILEVREALEEATTEEEVAGIRDTNRENTKETLASMKALLEAPTQQIDVAGAKNLLIRLRYQDNVEGVCKEWQPGKQIVLQH